MILNGDQKLSKIISDLHPHLADAINFESLPRF